MLPVQRLQMELEEARAELKNDLERPVLRYYRRINASAAEGEKLYFEGQLSAKEVAALSEEPDKVTGHLMPLYR